MRRPTPLTAQEISQFAQAMRILAGEIGMNFNDALASVEPEMREPVLAGHQAAGQFFRAMARLEYAARRGSDHVDDIQEPFLLR